MATISKGIKLHYRLPSEAQASDMWYLILNLQEIPELGGDTEAIEITTLDDAAHKYTDGIKNYGDTLAFKVLYDKVEFENVNQYCGCDGDVPEWRITLPDGTTCSFYGLGSVKLDGVGVNAALTYTLNIRVQSEMIWA